MDLLSFDAFFFDFDGLLVDTEPLHYAAYQVLLQRRSLSLPWDFTTYCYYAHQKTEVFAKAIYTLFPSLEKEQPHWMTLREEKQKIYQQLIETTPIPLMPGVAHLITTLEKHKKPMYTVTNATQNEVVAIRHHQPILDKIPTWISREAYKNPKPAPDGYLKALEIHGDPTCKGVGFEDAIRGLEALKQTPLTPVLILPPHYPRPDPLLLKDTHVFSSFEALL